MLLFDPCHNYTLSFRPAMTRAPCILVPMEFLRRCCCRRFPCVNLYGQSLSGAASVILHESIQEVDSSFAASLNEDSGRHDRTSILPCDDAPHASCSADNNRLDVSATLAAALCATSLTTNTLRAHAPWTSHNGKQVLCTETTLSDSEEANESQGHGSLQGKEQHPSSVETPSVTECSIEVKPN